jgi:hypothetical protein
MDMQLGHKLRCMDGCPAEHNMKKSSVPLYPLRSMSRKFIFLPYAVITMQDLEAWETIHMVESLPQG